MKKILSIILCILMLLPCVLLCVSATEEESEEPAEYTNIAKEALLKCSSYWNNDRLPKYTIDGVKNSSYQFWSPNYSGRDPNVDNSNHWIQYGFKDYKQINEILIYADSDACHAGVTYTLEALVLGEWVTITSTTHGEGVAIEEISGVSLITISIPDEFAPLITKKLRIKVAGHVLWEPPLVQEVEIMGKSGVAPEFDVPDGAELSTNAALSGYVTASSSKNLRYPALTANNDTTSDESKTTWYANDTEDGNWIMYEFDKAYDLEKIQLYFTKINANKGARNIYEINVELLREGVWTKEYENTNI